MMQLVWNTIVVLVYNMFRNWYFLDDQHVMFIHLAESSELFNEALLFNEAFGKVFLKKVWLIYLKPNGLFQASEG